MLISVCLRLQGSLDEESLKKIVDTISDIKNASKIQVRVPVTYESRIYMIVRYRSLSPAVGLCPLPNEVTTEMERM